jgi:hypothetical protein
MRMLTLSGRPVAVRNAGGLRRRAWRRWVPALALALVLGAFLWMFERLVTRTVHNGEMHREAMAAHSHEVWRCYALHGRVLRETCLRALGHPALQDSTRSATP